MPFLDMELLVCAIKYVCEHQNVQDMHECINCNENQLISDIENVDSKECFMRRRMYSNI